MFTWLHETLSPRRSADLVNFPEIDRGKIRVRMYLLQSRISFQRKGETSSIFSPYAVFFLKRQPRRRQKRSSSVGIFSSRGETSWILSAVDGFDRKFPFSKGISIRYNEKRNEVGLTRAQCCSLYLRKRRMLYCENSETSTESWITNSITD